MQLSVCIITKNEEKNLERCLKSIAPYGVEAVVVDTGSTDRTMEVAERYADCVCQFAWRDDFAAAKNFAISKASRPFVLVLDSDEYVEQMDEEALGTLLAMHLGEVGRVMRRNYMKKNDDREIREWLNRVFPKDDFFYEGRIHEQIIARAGGAYQTYHAPVVIGHTGYDLTKEEWQKKSRRNIRLLERELASLGVFVSEKSTSSSPATDSSESDASPVAASPAAPDDDRVPYLLFQLGKGYYSAGDYESACKYFSMGLSYDLDPRLEYVSDMVETYGYALLNSGQAEVALSFEGIYDTFGATADFQFLMGLIYMNNARFDDAVREFEKAMGHETCRSQGVNSYAARYNIGVIYECLGETEKARQNYEQCGKYAPALRRLREME